jgi:hypothetical protein
MLKTKKFWAYEFSQQIEIRTDFLENTKLKGRFFDDISSLYYEFIGSPPHPSLKQPYGKEYSEPSIISFINVLIDINTLKLLFYVIPNSNIITLKFSSNLFEFNNFEYMINSLINKQINIHNFIFEWNSEFKYEGKIYSINKKHPNNIDSSKSPKSKNIFADIREIINRYEENIIKFTISNKIEALCLRGNFLGDSTIKQMLENLKNNQSLKTLNLFKNDMTSECIPLFCEMLGVNRRLEEINIGGNNLKNEDLLMIKNSIGRVQLTDDDLEDYQKRYKEKEAVLERNRKNKGKKPDEPVPILEEVVEADNKFYLVRNLKLRSLNVMQNNFTEEIYEIVTGLLDISPDLLLTIDNKVFTKSVRERLNHPHSKYANRIYLAK